MSYFLKRIIHLLTATDQHGIHSPFVYEYITTCLYSKQHYSKKKSIDILLKSIAYFKVRSLLFPSEVKSLEILTKQKFPLLQIGIAPYDMIFTDASNLKNIEELIKKKEEVHNDSLILVDKIHKTKASELVWKQIKNIEKVTVTIDLFYCGIVFFRREQAKEHFKIRI